MSRSGWRDVTTKQLRGNDMMDALVKLEKILLTEAEYARTRFGRTLHTNELELALQIVSELIGKITNAKESVQ